MFAVLRLSRREPRRIPAVGHDVRQLSQATGLQHHRYHAREAAGGKLIWHITSVILDYCDKKGHFWSENIGFITMQSPNNEKI